MAHKQDIYLNHDYLTRDGHKVRIIEAREVGQEYPYPVVGEMLVSGLMEPYVWTRTGCFDKDAPHHPYDFVKDITA
jgi:hypothetical protein